jgi:hypothetical protein
VGQEFIFNAQIAGMAFLGVFGRYFTLLFKYLIILINYGFGSTTA